LIIILLGKSMAALAIVLAFRHPLSTAVAVSVSLAQIGEFSFILAGLGVSLALLPEAGRDLILAGALISIMLNPLLFAAYDWIRPRIERDETTAREQDQSGRAVDVPVPEVTSLTGHNVLVGAGRVGG